MALPKSQDILLARMVLATAVKEQDDDPASVVRDLSKFPCQDVPEASDLDPNGMMYLDLFARDAGFGEISPCFPLSTGEIS
jgi:hypothetical protein